MSRAIVPAAGIVWMVLWWYIALGALWAMARVLI